MFQKNNVSQKNKVWHKNEYSIMHYKSCATHFFLFFGLQFFKAKSPQGMPPRVPQFSLGNSTHPNIHTQYFYSQSQVRDFTSRQQLLSVEMAPPTWRTGFFFSFSPFGINRRRPGPYYRNSRSAVH